MPGNETGADNALAVPERPSGSAARPGRPELGSRANDARLSEMGSARNIARGVLPYVVIIWATLALLGSSHENGTHSAADAGAAIEAGAGICGAVTMAHLLRVGSGRIRPLVRRVFKRTPGYPARLDLFGIVLAVNTLLRVAYKRPPLFPPSLERLQIMRT
jgi:hypothetical protein